MPTYKAKEDGYHDDIFRVEGCVFFSSVEYWDGKGEQPKDMGKMPKWLEVTEEKPVVEPEEERKLKIVAAIKTVVHDDPEKENQDFWIGTGAPDVKELEKRLGFDISAKERDEAWASMNLPPSGGGPATTPPAPPPPPPPAE